MQQTLPRNIDDSDQIRQQVLLAIENNTPLSLRGGGSKSAWFGIAEGAPLNLAGHRGIVNYEPTELVITARAGTPLEDINAILSEHRQMLPFEPPSFTAQSTLGGAIACNLSGARRPFAGAARDYVLGTKMINGKGELLRFGGEVMKNVAGYDVSRGLAGSFGTLGPILEISLKVLPAPPSQITIARNHTVVQALELMNRWAAEPLPLCAAAFDGERLYVRLEGAASAVTAAQRQLGGETINDAGPFWRSLSRCSHGFFGGDGPLWRISVPPASAPLNLPGKMLYDWCGGLRWYRGGASARQIREVASAARGHATGFRGIAQTERFHPLDPNVLALHKRIKTAFDPKGLFNRGLMYASL